MINKTNSSVNFCGKFSIHKDELSKISTLQKLKFLKQKDAMIDEFCKKGTTFAKDGNNYILDIKDEKENKFLEFAKKLGLEFKKL
ncbi:MAG: hypothetical protein Q4F80_00920 [bacterium]|nr:hypothetical protein [bacterium]